MRGAVEENDATEDLLAALKEIVGWCRSQRRRKHESPISSPAFVPRSLRVPRQGCCHSSRNRRLGDLLPWGGEQFGRRAGFDSYPATPQEAAPTKQAGDGTLTLQCLPGRVTGQKLRFEPQPHKKTIGDRAVASVTVPPSSKTVCTFATSTQRGCIGSKSTTCDLPSRLRELMPTDRRCTCSRGQKNLVLIAAKSCKDGRGCSGSGERHSIFVRVLPARAVTRAGDLRAKSSLVDDRTKRPIRSTSVNLVFLAAKSITRSSF